MPTHFLFLFFCANVRLDLQSEMSEYVWLCVCVFLCVSILITTMSNNSCYPPPAAHIGRVCKQDVDLRNSQLF